MRNKWNKATIRVILTFTVVILSSFISENFHDQLGDWYCEGKSVIFDSNTSYPIYSGCDFGEGRHNPEWHYGYRHWMFILMGFILMIFQSVQTINILNKDQ